MYIICVFSVFCPYIGVENGRVSYSNSTLLASVLTITCKKGFKIVGEGKLTCGFDGSWNHPTPRCRKSNYNNIPFKFPHILPTNLCSEVKFKGNYYFHTCPSLKACSHGAAAAAFFMPQQLHYIVTNGVIDKVPQVNGFQPHSMWQQLR